MIKSMLDEIAAAATASLGTAITATATKYSVTLVSTFASETWFQRQQSLDRASWPVLGVDWKGTTTGTKLIAAGIREAHHKAEVTWMHQSATASVIETHMLYMPEALMTWLDTFPISSRSAGKTIHQIQPPQGQGITITPTPINARRGADGKTITYEWSVCLGFTVRTRESA